MGGTVVVVVEGTGGKEVVVVSGRLVVGSWVVVGRLWVAGRELVVTGEPDEVSKTENAANPIRVPAKSTKRERDVGT
ncbi:MAG: hypothetical protein Q8Q52_00615 [Acidimicrobiia bacterium]|nr:hypothetical protein [Acidimicrobiia bacterium]